MGNMKNYTEDGRMTREFMNKIIFIMTAFNPESDNPYDK